LRPGPDPNPQDGNGAEAATAKYNEHARIIERSLLIPIGIDLNYLIAAAFMSAPGGLLMAKLLMIPQRKHEIAQLGVKAVIAGSLSNLMSAALASVLLSF